MNTQEAPGAYRVFARAYRPQTFSDLLGQDALVKTLRGAFLRKRMAQAYMLTGVRGVGKTTTARLLARAFNYCLKGESCPSLDTPVLGDHCAAILESRHPDVIEMDAASRTGVDDVREIIEQVRYKPLSAPYKIYIIDEVHMLSKQAFNALLKTLEEPPDHVKFIFATTEIRKVPVTILSRCQRFDLKRLSPALLMDHLETVCKKEGVPIERDALRLLVRASEGSVRDSLSLLERAVAYGEGDVKAADVSVFLGLADRQTLLDLFEALMGGEIAEALSLLQTSYDAGGDSEVILSDLARLVHMITRFKIFPNHPPDESLTPLEEKRGRDLSQRLSMAVLARVWQMMLKGMSEVAQSPCPERATEMFFVRLGYSATLPAPADVIRSGLLGQIPLQEKPPLTSSPSSGKTQVEDQTPEEKSPSFSDFPALLRYVGEQKDLSFQIALEHYVRPIALSEKTIELSLVEEAPRDLGLQLAQRLKKWTGEIWQVLVHPSGGQATFSEREHVRHEQKKSATLADEAVQNILKRFPGAEVVEFLNKEDDALESDFPEEEGDEDEKY